MKYLRILSLVMVTILASCSSDNETPAKNELEGLTKFKEIANTTHTVELYKNTAGLEQGYNAIALKIKDKTTNQYIDNASISWTPLMHMTTMTHSCPASTIETTSTDKSVYKGYIVFQMAQNTTEYWDLKIDYTINGTAYTVTSVIDVPSSAKQRVSTFTGSDNVKYVVAYVEPSSPKVGVNDMKALVFKMQDMMTFPIVNNYTLKLDPRMPSMGNHSSPNNVDLTQTAATGFYNGKLSLTMTGYWKLNLQLVNASGTVLKGEAISDSVTASTLYFEIEF